MPGGRDGLTRAELLSDNPPQRLLERLTLPVHILSQSDIDQSLVVTTTGCMDLALEPLNEVIIQANGDTSLSRWNRNHRTSLSSAEVIFFSHGFFS
jgi:hypothetical protein